ncbi:hypothetical protein [Paenibacillus sp. FSL R7-0331]|uniref:hypothetical protein n=1 Tax=Paenibacillus sp. FSL R7-0331 TaxID=1536773 RepID=UPI0012E094DA|nr:hypothetical protein [Paenibacillus sp. FSL R7-0331]
MARFEISGFSHLNSLTIALYKILGGKSPLILPKLAPKVVLDRIRWPFPPNYRYYWKIIKLGGRNPTIDRLSLKIQVKGKVAEENFGTVEALATA